MIVIALIPFVSMSAVGPVILQIIILGKLFSSWKP